MEKVEYPKWKYHVVKEAVIVNSKEADDALGSEWVNSPADADADKPVAPPVKPGKKAKA